MLLAKEAIAKALVKAGQNQPPVNLRELSSISGITRVGTADIGPDAMLVSRAGGSDIIIKKNSPRVRQRFSWAHELGHYFLEPQHNGGKAFRGVTFHEIEKSCDQLAAEILIPSELFWPRFRSTSRPLSVAMSLASEFQVSIEAMVRRFSGLFGERVILSQWRFDHLSKPSPVRFPVGSTKNKFFQHGEPVNKLYPGYPEFSFVRRLFGGSNYFFSEEDTLVVRYEHGTPILTGQTVPTEGLAWGNGKYRKVFTLSLIDQGRLIET